MEVLVYGQLRCAPEVEGQWDGEQSNDLISVMVIKCAVETPGKQMAFSR